MDVDTNTENLSATIMPMKNAKKENKENINPLLIPLKIASNTNTTKMQSISIDK